MLKGAAAGSPSVNTECEIKTGPSPLDQLLKAHYRYMRYVHCTVEPASGFSCQIVTVSIKP